MSLLRFAPLALPALVALVALPAAAEPEPQDGWMLHAGKIDGEWAYLPDRPVVYPGSEVFIGHILSDTAHTITADDGSFRAEGDRDAWPRVLAPETPGEYAFHCEFHPTMRGVLVVVARDASAPSEPHDHEEAAHGEDPHAEHDHVEHVASMVTPTTASVAGLAVLGLVGVLVMRGRR